MRLLTKVVTSTYLVLARIHDIKHKRARRKAMRLRQRNEVGTAITLNTSAERLSET